MFPDILTTSAVTVVYVQNSALSFSRLSAGWWLARRAKEIWRKNARLWLGWLQSDGYLYHFFHDTVWRSPRQIGVNTGGDLSRTRAATCKVSSIVKRNLYGEHHAFQNRDLNVIMDFVEGIWNHKSFATRLIFDFTLISIRRNKGICSIHLNFWVKWPDFGDVIP